jgi:hypothetical protein
VTRSVGIVAVIIALWLSSSATDTAVSAVEDYGVHAEWLSEFLTAFRESVRRSPAWHNAQTRIQRYVQDIEYHANQMVSQASKPDRARAEEEGQHLTALLRRGRGKGYLSAQDVESLIELMNKYLPVAQA